MIFLAVGTQKFPFDRLLKSADKLISDGVITEEVFAQTGTCTYTPQNFEYRSMLSKAEFEERIKNCSLLITHSGVGTIISGLKARKPVIVMPRLKKYGEHVDDHQLDIAKAFSDRELVLMCGDDDSLSDIIEKARTYRYKEYVSSNKKAVEMVRAFLNRTETKEKQAVKK